MKIGVLGAGISGLSIARLLKDDFEVEVLEKEPVVGGIARTKDVDGMTYHVNGGHCFDSKYEDVKEFVFNKVLSKTEWNGIKRETRIYFRGKWISYPIEFSVKQINDIDSKLAFDITYEMLNASYEKGKNLEEWFINHFGPTLAREYFIPYNTKIWGIEPKNMDSEMLNASYEKGKNLEEWFINHFGPTLAREYFIPYNTKIWGIEPKNMDSVWTIDDKQMKLPVPDKVRFFESLFGNVNDGMAHQHFYYPKTNNQNTFIEAIGNGVNIILNYPIKSIEKNAKKWVINGEREYDVIFGKWKRCRWYG